MDLQTLSQIELRQICYFLVIVQAGNHFSEAAHYLGIKQPPLSQSIQTLEKWLSLDSPLGEVKLFDRRKRPVELTEAGQIFLEEVQLALMHLERGITQAQRASQGHIGRLIIGINNSIANSILAEVLQEFQKRFPDVELALREVPIPEEIPMLKNRQLDVIFQRSPYPNAEDLDLNVLPILDEYFIVALPESHPLAHQHQIPIQALQHEPMILPPLDILPFYENVVTLCRSAGFEPKTHGAVTVTGVVTILSLVAAGVGVSILPNHVQTLHREGVVYRSIQNAKLTRQIAVVWRQTDQSRVLQNFLTVVQEIVNLPLLDSW